MKKFIYTLDFFIGKILKYDEVLTILKVSGIFYISAGSLSILFYCFPNENVLKETKIFFYICGVPTLIVFSIFLLKVLYKIYVLMKKIWGQSEILAIDEIKNEEIL